MVRFSPQVLELKGKGVASTMDGTRLALSPRTSLLGDCARMKRVPEPAAVIRSRRTGGRGALHFAGFSLGDELVGALSRANALLEDGVQSVDLSQNRLSDAGSAAVVERLGARARELDLSGNRIRGVVRSDRRRAGVRARGARGAQSGGQPALGQGAFDPADFGARLKAPAALAAARGDA
jgi:hypothetical protein